MSGMGFMREEEEEWHGWEPVPLSFYSIRRLVDFL